MLEQDTCSNGNDLNDVGFIEVQGIMMKSNFSLSFGAEQANASTYLLVTGIFLFSNILTIPSAYARRISPVEVVVYEGVPIDYSNRDDVIFIDETPYQDKFLDVVVTPNYVNGYSNQAKMVASQTNPSYQAKPIPNSKMQPRSQLLILTPATKPKAISLAVKSIDRMTQAKLTEPLNVLIDNTKIPNAEVANTETASTDLNNGEIKNTEIRDLELASFYANVFKLEKRSQSKQATLFKAVTQNLAQEKSQSKPIPLTNPNEVQLSLIASKGRVSKLSSNKAIPNKALIATADGKDPELVAFYMDVFAKQNNNLSNQSLQSVLVTVAVKEKSVKSVAQKQTKAKNKLNEVQLSLKTSKVKDPELVAFYKQVFDNDTKSSLKHSSKYVPTIAASKAKAKDPDLVAFYEREFGKSTDSPLMPVLTNNVSSKVAITAKTKSDKKRVASKVVKKVKVKTTSAVGTELAELQELIDDLTNQKII